MPKCLNVRYTLQGGQRGPPSQPEARGVASGKWAPTRLFPSEAPMCPSTLCSQLSQSRYATLHSAMALSKKYSLSKRGVLCLDIKMCSCLQQKCNLPLVWCAVQSGHGTGLLSPKQSGMDRASTIACLEGKAAQDKQKNKQKVQPALRLEVKNISHLLT